VKKRQYGAVYKRNLGKEAENEILHLSENGGGDRIRVLWGEDRAHVGSKSLEKHKGEENMLAGRAFLSSLERYLDYHFSDNKGGLENSVVFCSVVLVWFVFGVHFG